MEAIISILVLVEIAVILWIMFIIAVRTDINRNKYMTITLKNYIRELFVERNFFGMFLSFVVFVIGIPAFLIIILLDVIISMAKLFMIVWNLGNKNND